MKTTKKTSSILSLAAGLIVMGAAQTARAETYGCMSTWECYEQDGSYPLACDNVDVLKFTGSHCSDQCDIFWGDGSTADCMGGCYSSKKNILEYDCSVPTPTATDVTIGFDVSGSDVKLVGMATVSNGYDPSDSSERIFYAATSSSGAGSTVLLDSVDGTNGVDITSALASGYTYFQFCIIPEVTGGSTPSGSITSTGTEVCTSWGTQGEVVKATNITQTIFGNQAQGSYTYSDSAGVPEDTGNTSFQYLRADDASGTNWTVVGHASTYTLTTADEGKYLAFCVMPYSENARASDYYCGGWALVGHMVELFQNENQNKDGGSSLSIAYRWANAGTCFNLADYAFDNEMTSFSWSTASSAETLTFYTDVGCSGSTLSSSLAGNSSTTNSNVGSSFNDQASSFRVGTVTAVQKQLSMDGTCYAPGTTLMQNGYDKLDFQGDGNLVLYRTYNTASQAAAWAAGTNGKGATDVCLQADGNIVVYAGSSAVWASNTNGKGVTTLTLQSDCNLVLYSGSSAAWATGTNPC